MTIKRFIKTAGLLLAGQVLLWLSVGGLSIWLSSHMSGVLTACFFAYAPTILLVDLLTNYVGTANIIIPLYLGIAIGIVVYSIIGAIVLNAIRARRDRQSTPSVMV